MKLTVKTFSTIAAALFILGIVAACGAAEEPGAPQNPQPAAPAQPAAAVAQALPKRPRTPLNLIPPPPRLRRCPLWRRPRRARRWYLRLYDEWWKKRPWTSQCLAAPW